MRVLEHIEVDQVAEKEDNTILQSLPYPVYIQSGNSEPCMALSHSGYVLLSFS